jgi:flagellar motor switch protein FliM
MAEKRESSTVAYTSVIKLTPAIGDWTTLKPVRAQSKKVKTGLYGFDRLSQEDLKLAHTIHYNFGQALTASLKKNLSVGGELFTVAAEQSTYSNFINKVYQPTVQSKISIPNLAEEVVVCLDMPVANTIINHSLGGSDIAPITRKLTDIEEGVFIKAFSEILQNYANAFEKIFEAPTLEVVNSPDLSMEDTISPTSTFVFFSIEFSVGDNPPGTMWLGYPSSLLKTLVENVEKRQAQRPVNFAKLPPSALDGISVPLIIELGETAVATQDLQSLESGDVISLDTALGGFVPVYLGGYVKILGRAGTKGGRLAVRTFKGGEAKLPKAPAEMPMTEEESPAEDNLSLENKSEEGYPIEEEEGAQNEEFTEEEGI